METMKDVVGEGLVGSSRRGCWTEKPVDLAAARCEFEGIARGLF